MSEPAPPVPLASAHDPRVPDRRDVCDAELPGADGSFVMEVA
jgi:hypothetical protein